jgi:hypothetical protein
MSPWVLDCFISMLFMSSTKILIWYTGQIQDTDRKELHDFTN